MAKHTTKLYRNVEQIMDDMAAVETEFRAKPTPRSRAQLLKVLDRMHILTEEIQGMTGTKTFIK